MVADLTPTKYRRSPKQKRIAQKASHAQLFQDASLAPPPSIWSKRGHLDAIIVPASRPASFLQPAIELAASLDVLLVVLCSKQTRIDQVAHRVANAVNARCLIISTDGWSHPELPSRTSRSAFFSANAGRSSDLSLKRNLGLLLARSRGWNKIAYIDDDIVLAKTDSLARLADQLETRRVAGMVVSRFPDNSVVCHARRMAKLPQDVFVTGAVLGVHCNSLPLSFFPDIYNEDWFFFAKEAACRRLPRVGHAVQAEYEPFATPDRARWEEFGDLLAEGLFAYFDDCDNTLTFDKMLRRVNSDYWSQFIEARRVVIDETRISLTGFADRDPGNRQILAALSSLAAAQEQLDDEITPDLCLDFIEAWRADLDQWQRFSSRVNNLGGTREAMDFLGLKDWKLVEYGRAEVSARKLERQLMSADGA